MEIWIQYFELVIKKFMTTIDAVQLFYYIG